MLFYFLTTIVFISEIIITLTLIIYFVKADKIILKYNAVIEETRPSIKEVMILVHKISKQLVELTPMFKERIKTIFLNILADQLKNTLCALTFWIVKKEVEKHVQ